MDHTVDLAQIAGGWSEPGLRLRRVRYGLGETNLHRGVDVPARFRKSKSVGAVFGLTCARYQSGEIDWSVAVILRRI